jgi:hypothetical protein
MMTDEQLAKLPQYAQREIQILRRDLKYLREERVRTEKGETDVYYETLGDKGFDKNYLPKGSGVVFHDNIRVRTLEQGGFVDIMSIDGGLEITPAASNHIYIRGGRR